MRLLISEPDAAWYNPEAAVKAAQEAQQLAQGQDPKAIVALADALLAGRRPQEALELIETAYTRFRDDRDVISARERIRKQAQEKNRKP
ncbi:MAG: hypothetical protein M5U26_05410 [Planctomycetota bacterium]|nr:hypothetical protein [Planctomycetota bacterium]